MTIIVSFDVANHSPILVNVEESCVVDCSTFDCHAVCVRDALSEMFALLHCHCTISMLLLVGVFHTR